MLEFQHGCRISYNSITPLWRLTHLYDELEVKNELAEKRIRSTDQVSSSMFNSIEAFTSIKPLRRELWYHYNLFKSSHTGSFYYEGNIFYIFMLRSKNLV